MSSKQIATPQMQSTTIRIVRTTYFHSGGDYGQFPVLRESAGILFVAARHFTGPTDILASQKKTAVSLSEISELKLIGSQKSPVPLEGRPLSIFPAFMKTPQIST
jgi:hypothetical protein